MRLTSRIILVALLGISLASANSASADLASFDFESAPVDGIEDGSNPSLIVSDSGLTITITRTSGTNFDVLNDDAFGFPNAFPTPGWGNQALSPFVSPGVNDFFLANLSAPADIFGVQMGDFGGDTDDLILQAWSGLNGTGTLLDTDTGSFSGDFNLTGAGDGPANLVVFGVGIQSVTFRGGSAGFENSVYYDNFRVSFVPEPSTLSILCVASLGMAFRRRRLK